MAWVEWSTNKRNRTKWSYNGWGLKKNTNIYLVYINLANSKTNILHFHANTYYLFVKKLILKPLSSLKSTMLSIFKWFVNDLLSPKLRWIALVVLIYELGANHFYCNKDIKTLTLHWYHMLCNSRNKNKSTNVNSKHKNLCEGY